MSKINVWLRAKEKVIIVVVCCACMVAWFVGPSILSLITAEQLKSGTIFGRRISGNRVAALAKCLAALTRSRTGEEAIARAWQAVILEEEAARYGIRATDADVAGMLQANFRGPTGGLDEEAYLTFLRNNRLSRSDFETGLQSYLTGKRVEPAVLDSVSLTAEEAWLWYSRQKQQVKARYIQLNGKDLAPLAAVDEDQLRAFHQRYAQVPRRGDRPGYLAPERVKIEYVMAPYAKYEAAADITEDQIRDYYESHKEEFRLLTPEKEKDAEKQPGEPKDEQSTETSAEEAKPEPPAPTYRPLAEVSAEIEQSLRRQTARRVVDELMKQVHDEIWKAYETERETATDILISLGDIAKKLGLDHKITRPFSNTEVDKILPGATGLVERAFGQGTKSIGYPSTTLSATDGKFVFQVLEIFPPSPTPYEKVKERVEQDLRVTKGFDLAKEITKKAVAEDDMEAAARVVAEEITALLEALPEDSRPEKKADAFFKAGESNYFQRPEFWTYQTGDQTGLPGPFTHADFAREAFASKAGERCTALDDTRSRAAFVLERTDVRMVEREAFERDQADAIPLLLQQKRAAVLATWRDDLRRRAQPSEEIMKFLRQLPEWAG